jgi:hypothetical protein
VSERDDREDEERPDLDRDAILRRRNTFIAMALSGLTSVSVACDDGIPGVTPEPCLSQAPADPQPCLSAPPAELIPIETPAEKPPDEIPPADPPPEEELVDQTDEAEGMDMTGPRPRPCLRVRPRPCLSIRPPRPPPTVCLSVELVPDDPDSEG